MNREYSDAEAERIRKQTAKIYQKFRLSPNFQDMFKYCQKEAEDVIEQLGFFAYGYDSNIPKEWTIDVFLSQVYNIQRKCMFSDTFFKALPKVIYHFSKFCVANRIGDFDLKNIEKFKEDLKEGMYEDDFSSSWDDAYEERMKDYDALM